MVATTAPQAIVTRRVETMHVATLPPFSNQRGCPRCGARYEIRVLRDTSRPSVVRLSRPLGPRTPTYVVVRMLSFS